MLKIFKDGLLTDLREKKVFILMKGCGRKMKDLNMEKNLIKWINIQIESGNQDILN